MKRFMLATSACLLLAACSQNQIQTAAAVGTPIAQTLLSIYAAKKGAKPAVVEVGNALIGGIAALEAAATTTGGVPTETKAVALAAAAVQQIQADDSSATVKAYAPVALAGLGALKSGQPVTAQAAAALGSVLAAYIADEG